MIEGIHARLKNIIKYLIPSIKYRYRSVFIFNSNLIIDIPCIYLYKRFFIIEMV